MDWQRLLDYGFSSVLRVLERALDGLTPDDLDGLEIKWGDTEAAMELMEMIVQRKGVGDILAEGARKASEILGKGSEYVMDVKGMSVDSRDPRGSKGWGQ